MMKQEFIYNPSVRVLRWKEKLLIFPSLIMFRIHETTQVVKYDHSSTGHHQQILSHKTRVANSSPLPFKCCCSHDPDSFRKVVRNALDVLGLFEPHNNQMLSETVPEYFHSCYNCNCYTADRTSPKIIVMVEVYEKTVYIAKPAIGEFNEEEQETIRYCGKLAAADQELMDVDEDEDEDEEEDYSELALGGILGNLIRELMVFRGYQLSTLRRIDELFQVKAAIRMSIYNGRRCGSDQDECAICFEGFCEGHRIAKMPCSHVFHKNCAFKWLIHRSSCPLCRTQCKTPIL